MHITCFNLLQENSPNTTITTIETLTSSLQLPSQWISNISSESLHLCKLKFPQIESDSAACIVTHSLTISEDLSWTALVHGHQVNSTKCTPLSDVPHQLNSESLKVLVAKLDSCWVCPGHPDKKFVEMVISKKGKLTSINKEVVATIDSAVPVQLNGDLYTQTVRHKSCAILTNDTKCAKCVQYRDTLRKSFHRWKKKINTSPCRNTASTSHTNLAKISGHPSKTTALPQAESSFRYG